MKSKAAFIAIAFCWAILGFWFRDDMQGTLGLLFQYLGPMCIFIVPLGGYILFASTVVFKNRNRYSEKQKIGLLNHLEDMGETAAVNGLLGTILAMVFTSKGGDLDMTQFLISLISTFVGSFIAMLTTLFRSVMTRPGLFP